MSDFSLRLRSLRRTSNVNQNVIASQIGVSLTTVSRWENGLQEPSIEMLMRLATTLKTSVAYLMGETNDPSAPSSKPRVTTGEAEGESEGYDSRLVVEMYEHLKRYSSEATSGELCAAKIFLEDGLSIIGKNLYKTEGAEEAWE